MKNVVKHILSIIFSILFIGLTGCLVIWMSYAVHPFIDSNIDVSNTDIDISSQLQGTMEDSKISVLNEFLSENEYIKKIYSIEPGVPVPVPYTDCYGEVAVADAAMMQDVIDKANELGVLDGQELVFNTDIPFSGSRINYYLDETILVICWKELIGGTIYSFAEVKIMDPSQFRRKLVDDTYGSPKKLYCTDLARQANAVLALNADFYAFRNLGITCYEGVIYRTDNTLDTLFIDENGGFVFYERGQNASKEELQAFVDENNLQFSLSFGPILIKDGELIHCSSYPIGEVNEPYSRAGIGLMDNLHYLYINAENHGENLRPVPVNTFAQVMYDKGVVQGYNLDGGQTGETVLGGKIMNFIDFGNQRDVSDIIFFATALPPEDYKP